MTLLLFAARALQFLLASPKLRASFSASLASEGRDVSPTQVAALSGDADAIKLLSDEIDEAIATNTGIQARLRDQVRREGTGLDS